MDESSDHYKKIFVTMLLLFLLSSPIAIYAAEWAYSFVIYNGNVYQVTDEKIEQFLIKELIGEVSRYANEPSDEYHGNASNIYPIVTGYYKIDAISVKKAIAVKVDGEFIKAEYERSLLLHWGGNVVQYTIPIIFLSLLIVLYRFRENIKKAYKESLS